MKRIHRTLVAAAATLVALAAATPALADHGDVLEPGAFALQGPADQRATDPRVIETYLGASRQVL